MNSWINIDIDIDIDIDMDIDIDIDIDVDIDHLEYHLILISNLNPMGLFSTKRAKRDLED